LLCSFTDKFRPEDRREIVIPWKEGEEPDWLNKMLAEQEYALALAIA
jgi:hypothetical protein